MASSLKFTVKKGQRVWVFKDRDFKGSGFSESRNWSVPDLKKSSSFNDSISSIKVEKDKY